jgi:hypothetical protein
MKLAYFCMLIGVITISSAFAQTPSSTNSHSQAENSGSAGAPHRWRNANHDMKFGRANTSGWSMMNEQERKAHHDKMMGISNSMDCTSYQSEHHKLMLQRAKDRGLKPTAKSLINSCSQMDRRGHFGPKVNSLKLGKRNTPGWSLMSAEERTLHHEKMLNSGNLNECKAYLEQHHKLMESRAAEKDYKLPAVRQADMCIQMKRKGHFKSKG